MRTDDNHNPTAFTTDVAHEGGLVLAKDYTQGTQFPPPDKLFTAYILGDPVAITIRLIDNIGFYTSAGVARWGYMGKFPHFIWLQLTAKQKRDVIGFMYQYEGGTGMRHLFPNYGKR